VTQIIPEHYCQLARQPSAPQTEHAELTVTLYEAKAREKEKKKNLKQ